jgi:hypothetical protein
MQTGRLYKIYPQNYRGNNDSAGVLLLSGVVSISLVGSTLPKATSNEMTDILGVAIEADGAYVLPILTVRQYETVAL